MLSPDAVRFFPPRAGKPRRAIHSIPIGRVMALEIFYSPRDSDLPEHRQKRLRIGMKGIKQRSVPVEQNPAQPAWNSSARHDGRRVANISSRLSRTLLSSQAMLPLQNTKRSAGAPLLGRTNVGQWLEREPNGKLGLPRVTDSFAQETVEVEQSRRHQRIHIVLVVEGVEHFHGRDDLHPFTQLEWPLQPPIEREVAIVLANAIAAPVHAVEYARLGRHGPRGVGLR